MKRMLPVDELARDSRTSPRVYQQVDWSNGGDGIVVRDSIKSVSQLRGRTVSLAQNSPSQYFLMNLLINAAHAIGEDPRQDARITIRTWAEADSVFAEVRDNGSGIAPPDLARIFEPFFSTKQIGTGSGLGLSICRNIIDEFGGDIRVESELGKGTRFIVRLPAPAEAPQLLAKGTRSPASAASALRGRVLIIDDEALLRTAMKRLLTAHDVVTASSGKEAETLLEHDRDFDLILCDLMMPGITGMDVHHWLKALDPQLAKRMVFITGGAFGRVAAEYLSEAGNLRLEKPFDSDALEQIVDERVRFAKSEPPPESEPTPKK